MITYGNMNFFSTYYTRTYKNGKTVRTNYADTKTISIRGIKFDTHRAIAFVKATPYQRARFFGYDAHHADGNHANNTLDNIVVLTVAKHRQLHAQAY